SGNGNGVACSFWYPVSRLCRPAFSPKSGIRSGVGYPVSGIWCLVSGIWCLVSGVWCLVSSVWCLSKPIIALVEADADARSCVELFQVGCLTGFVNWDRSFGQQGEIIPGCVEKVVETNSRSDRHQVAQANIQPQPGAQAKDVIANPFGIVGRIFQAVLKIIDTRSNL